MAGLAISIAAIMMLWSGGAQAQVSGSLTATDTTIPPYDLPAQPALAGGGGALWAGGALNFPAEPDGSGGDGVQVYRGVAARLQAPPAACTNGTATITASVRVTNNGPTAGAAYSGRLALFDSGDTMVATETTFDHPVGVSRTLTITSAVPAADLAAGNLTAALWLETYHAGSKGWTADQFQATYSYAGCEADLSITKDDGATTYTPGLDTSYTIVVTNNGPDDVTGAQITDPLPAPITQANWTCGGEIGGAVCGAPSGTGAIDTTADLPSGASVTYTLTMGIPSSYSGSLTNTATVTAPDGVTDTNTANNSASDTDTMEPPPTSGACSPRAITPAMSFTMAPLPGTGSVGRSPATGWNAANPWIKEGGDYVLQWSFSEAIPAEQIQFGLFGVADVSVGATFTITLGAGSTATVGQMAVVAGQFTHNGSGVIRRVPATGTQVNGIFGFNGTGTITSLRITTDGVPAADYIAHNLYVRPACLTVAKVSEDGTDSFQFDMTNVVQADGTVVPSTTLTTTTAGTAVSSPTYNSVPGTDLSLSEIVPANWNLASAICTDQNAGTTGNPTVIGSLTSPTLTIPGENVRPESDIQCLFTNRQMVEADLAITKDDGVTTYTPGLDTTYTIVVTNNGPDDVTGAQITDPLPAPITQANWTCDGEIGGAVCGAPSGTGAIDTTADLPSGASVTYTLTMGIPSSYSGSLTNTATVTAPDGATDTNTANNTASDTDTMEPPPTSGACSPRNVVQGSSFTLAPFANGGTVTKSAGTWATTSEWTKLGGNFTLTWTFNQPLPAEWLQFNLIDIDPISPNGTLTISLGGGVSTSQIVKIDGDLLLGAGGVVRRDNTSTDDPGQSASFRFAPGSGSLTSITITSANIHSSDNIANQLFVRPSCLTVAKVSEDGTDSFEFNMTNVVQADGTAVPSTTLTTTTPGTPVSSPAYHAIPGTDLILSEVVPAGWGLESAVCTDQNAGGTGNPTVIGSLSSPTLTIPGGNVRPESVIQCQFRNIIAEPAMTVEKTGTLNDLDGDGLIDLGETISYSFLVTNDGNVTLTGVTVDDPLLTNAGVLVSPGPQTLAPGGSATFTATYTPTQADIDNGSVTNTATGTGTPPDGGTFDSPPDSTTVPPDQTPGLSVEKTGTLNDLDGDGLIDLGETISYSFLVTNTGTVTMTNVTVDDPLLANAGVSVSPAPQTLAPGGSATFTATYTPTQADIDNGSVTNTATGTGTPPGGGTFDSPPDSTTVPPDQTPGLVIDKTGTLNDLDGDGLIDLGETISYSFLVTNTGTVTMSNVTVNDPLVTIDQGPQTLAPGASFTFTATYTPTQADIDNGSVTNTATGTGTDPGGGTNDSPPDSVTVPPDQTPAMTVDKTGTLNDLDGDGLIDPGETIGYSFRVTNTGTVTLSDVTVDDPLLANAGISVSQGPQTLAPGGSFTFTATYTPTQAEIDSGAVTNTATGTGTDPGGGTNDSPPDTVTVPPDQTPGLSIEKTGTLNDLDGDGLIDLGETISYSFRVANTGSVTMTNVTVNDPLLTNAGISVSPAPLTLGPGGSATFTATYTPTQADIDNGSVTNTATGTGTDPGGGTTDSPPDSITVPPDQTPGLSIEKTGTLNDGDGDGLLDLGETISYSFLVTNTGLVTMTDVTVDDPLLANAGVSVSPGPQTLAPGGSVTFTATYAPTQADIDTGSVTNTASGTGTGPGGGTTDSPPDSVTVPPEEPSLNLQKSGRFNDVDGNGHASLGDTLIYTFTVTNDGGQTVADVWPEDAGPTFNGRRAGGSLSGFEPGPVTLGPGQQVAFTATYTLTEDDILNAAAVADGIANSATVSGQTGGGGGTTSNSSTSIITMPAAVPGDIVIAKVALLRHIRRGEEAPFAITVTNNAGSLAQGLTIIDTLPSGFRYVDGSASIGGVAATPIVDGRRVIFENVDVAGHSAVEVRLRMLALSSAGPGEHVNRASVTDAAGNPLAPDATASVEILVEPVFDCGDIIGKVFDDKNRNGYQDEGEFGLPGVRIATVNGWLVTSDAHGRFHVACAALPDQRIGTNFIMKVDTRTLPTGYRLTTENPRVVRLTAGKMTELNFGASIGRVVRLDLKDDAFEAGNLELRPQWAQGIDQLIGFLGAEQSVLRLTYIDPGADPDLAEARLRHLADVIGARWRQTSGQYRLEIEMRVEAGQ